MICNTIGQMADSYQSIYVTGGTEVAEVYGGINYADPIFYKTETMTGSAPLMYDSYPGRLTGYTILGNSFQNGTPTPEDPVEVQSWGDLVTTGEHAGEFAIPIVISDGTNSQTANIYLDEPLRKIGNYADEIDFKAGTVTRRIREVVLTGSETIDDSAGRWIVRAGLINSVPYIGKSTHFRNKSGGTVTWFDNAFSIDGNSIFFGVTEMFDSMNAFKQLLTDSYTDGNPVTVYYASTRPITESVTLPQIPTISGQNTLSFGTALQPSQVSITGHIKPVTS